LLQTVTHHFGQPFAVVADSAYKTVPIAHHLLKQGILPVFPYTRPNGCHTSCLAWKKDFLLVEKTHRHIF
ncbi:hypothetical protein, partial [Exiguobacterium sp. Leaf196]|uniref:hypothetical protein n=1 Tax=Exiguobacterium sp. Leaf196 TaxID=1736298 RepID=UPI001F4169F3